MECYLFFKIHQWRQSIVKAVDSDLQIYSSSIVIGLRRMSVGVCILYVGLFEVEEKN